jgi:glutathione synthase/RimK-type ligase-like ATP-grasp enzyme
MKPEDHRALPMATLQPSPVHALATLLRMTQPELQALLAEVHGQGDLARVCLQMYYVFLMHNQTQAALAMQQRALRQQRLYRLCRSAGSPPPTLRLLVLMGPGHMQDNTPIEFVLEHSDVQTDLLFLLPGEALPVLLPLHDLVFVAIGESDKNAATLAQLQASLPRWPRPFVNPPAAIGHCARDRCCQLLSGLAGVRVPYTRRLLAGEAGEMAFPFTLRPVDTQGGEGLQRIDGAEERVAYFAAHPAPAYYAAGYLDYRSADGLYRKYRLVLIAGAPFICHLAISDHWMVHYLSAGMAESAAKRLEEQQCMEGFAEGFGLRHREALLAIAQALQLDYVTIDCAETVAGELLVFEVDSRGLIHAADPVEIYPYKPAVMQKAFDAFRALLQKRAALATLHLPD